MVLLENQNHFGFHAVEANEKQGMVDDVFHSVAQDYDRMNDAMSLGMHHIWKDAMIAWAGLSSKRKIKSLDVAGGTGDIALRIAKNTHPQSDITILDINHDMLSAGKARPEMAAYDDIIHFVQANGESLPLPSHHFDLYTIAFGIRNVPDIEKALAEAYRVLKPGGRFMCLEFSHVDIPWLDKIYDYYSFHAIPELGKLIANDKESYQYLVESIRLFPNADLFSMAIEKAGFQKTRYRKLSGGIVAIHSAWKV